MSRVTTSGFEQDETIGLYITVQPSTIEKTRYIDNMKFSYDPLIGFSPEETIFFPEGNNKCDFISYHPYKKNAITKGESNVKVDIQTNQSSKAALSASDFMTATTNGVATSKNPVALAFQHKLFQLNIRLNPVSGYTAEMLLAANPAVKVKNVYTRATYNFTTDKFVNHNTKADVTPHGSWKIEDGMLCGKSAIIIPQTLPQSHIVLELYIEDRLFECKMGSEYVLNSGTAENNTITLQSSSDATKNTISTSISNWITKDAQWTANETGTVIQTSLLNFTASNIVKVMNKDKQVAEICLEYLRTNEIAGQAIVIYPMTNGKANLTKGLVVELKEETGDKHGGSVNWNTAANSLTYTEGTSSVISHIFITEDGEVKTTRPAKALQLQLKPDLLADSRGEESIEYPVVKIGTQYWTRSNLKATRYTNGALIVHGGTVVNNSTPQYYTHSNAYYFYNAACVATNNVIPNGCRVGNETDYSRLITYVNDNAAVLKNNTNTWSDNSNLITNLTGFNGTGVGNFNKTYTNSGTAVVYWCANNGDSNVLAKTVTLSSNSNKIIIGNAAVADMALAIRCVRN